MTDEEFVDTFNEYYPFERYIVKNPQRINYLYDDVKLVEVFVPSTEIKPITYTNRVTGREEFLTNTEVNADDIYVKLICNGTEFRMSYYDFNDGIRETIIENVIEDMGDMNWESLYIDFSEVNEDEELEELKDMLMEQKKLIIDKYGVCNIKDNFEIEDTLKLLK